MFSKIKVMSLVVFAIISLSCAISPSNLYAASKFAGIKKVMVIDFNDQTGKFNGAKIADQIRTEMASQADFNVVSKSQMLSKFKKLKIVRSKMKNSAYRKSVSKYLDVDALVTGTVSKEKYYTLTIKMERVKTLATVNTSSVLFKNDVGPNVSRVASLKFLGLPYETALKTPPPPGPTQLQPKEMETSTTQPSVQTKGRAMTTEEEKVPGILAKKEEPKKEEESEEDLESGHIKRDLFTLKVSSAFYKNSYSVKNPTGTSDIVDLSTGFFPVLNVTGELWFIRYLGIDLSYNVGFLTLNVNSPAFSVSTRFTQFGGSVKYRYFFSDNLKSPYVFAKIGYSLQKFSPGDQATSVLSGIKYNDLPVGIGFNVPFWFLKKPDLGFNFNFDYLIWSSLHENLINNGTTNSTKGYQLALGPYWKFYKSLLASFDFTYNHHGATYGNPDPANGTRAEAVSGAKSSDSFTGILLSLGFTM